MKKLDVVRESLSLEEFRMHRFEKIQKVIMEDVVINPVWKICDIIVLQIIIGNEVD